MIISRTPFRISFFGGGTDYPAWYRENGGGAVLSTSIDKYCYLSCREYPPFFDSKLRVVWSKIELAQDADEIEHPSVRETLKYLDMPEGVEIHHHGDLPARSGVGSSSSFTVGLLNTLHALKGNAVISKKQLALDAIHVEQNLIQENVGSQDQVAAAFGGLNKIIFGEGGDIGVEPIDIEAARKRALNDRLMLFFTGLSRTASEIAAEWIKHTPKKRNELHTMRSMVDDAVSILVDGSRDIDDFGRMLHETWMIKRELNPAVTLASIDAVYEGARRAGAIGGKLLGAGSGGFMLIYADPDAQTRIREALSDLLYVPFCFDEAGSHIIYNSLENNEREPSPA